ncbi:GNAT family N-acetyltransferase [Candidatus Stoquefichus sp. SB1]|jgi:ribosomal protein S18 acetylase RimI-like enzyme|uniref:GNAT family N-acetyltransferase n=1 Tax=Candidatus Stoquefichus sp. SB1 TaxID=1658109 RepID=UPI00067EF8AE|nr:GNAT family N-acetyltransferase [Candidatus Stoquefichus sp. SB1]
MNIRKARIDDLSRIAEIYVFNNRMNYFPIFKDESFSFGELQVVSLADKYFGKDEIMKNIFIYDDNGLIKGFIQMDKTEICKIYVDTFFQSEGIGNMMIEYAIKEFHADNLWVLEKNSRAISFYQTHGFYPTGEKKFEEDTTEYLLKLVR